MKDCRTCGEAKAIDQFYTADNSCKECRKEKVRAYRAANIDRIRQYDRNRPNAAERLAENRRRYREAAADPSAREKLFVSSAEWVSRNQEKRKAHIIVGNAIRDGKLKVKPCERCGFALGVHAHHEDYGKPLDVTWLCKKCHGARHREINEERRRSA